MKTNQPLLTIAIPTYNRASILDGSLAKLLPQIIKHNDKIEFIISDNASNDNTQEVINKYKLLFPNINFVSYLQQTNTGYYGNFQKCKELSNGLYFWLLSDNEHIKENIVNCLLDRIELNQNKVGVYYLADTENNVLNRIEAVCKEEFCFIESNFDKLLENETAWLLTGISSVVLLNLKHNDNYVENKYKNNPFLGFLYLINSLKSNNKIEIINGSIYDSINCNVYFDLFTAWSKDIMECVDYMFELEIVDDNKRTKFINGFLKNNLFYHVNSFRKSNVLHGKIYNNKKQIKKILDCYFNNNEYYREYIKPMFLPSIIYKLYINIKIKFS